MGLDWDVLLNDVSIKGDISTFAIRQEKGGYAKELTLFSVDSDFFDSFTYNTTPELCIEIKTKLTDTWVSQGFFYIEKPAYSMTPSQKISRGVWGRSETAKAGEPFTQKITQTWDERTTIQGIISEMAALVEIDVTFNIDDYPVYANTYSVDLKYPIEVISELCKFAGAFLSCDNAGNLLIEKDLYHPGATDFTIDDNDISDFTESVSYPDFGNRIKVSSFGNNTGYQINLTSLEDSDCLQADGESELTLLALVTLDDEPVEDNILISWTTEDGVTLSDETSSTGSYLLNKQLHQASGYNKVTVDYPILSIVGIWAYSDTSLSTNYWDESASNCTFDGKEITLSTSLAFCDQTLLISYIATGIALNTATSGILITESEVTASLEGAEGSLELTIGNICACGSSLGIRKIPDSSICIGNMGYVLAWAEIGNAAANEMIATFSLSGCGSLSSTNKTLGDVVLTNESAVVFNAISGTTQVRTDIEISDTATPAVYLETDSSKTDNLYLSHVGKLIDLDTVLENSTEVVIDYTAAGATAISFLTGSVTTDEDGCDADITVKVADGTEEGLEESVTYSASDCSDDDDDDDDPEDNDSTSVFDPSAVDFDTGDGGDSSEDAVEDCVSRCEGDQDCIDACEEEGGSSGVILTDCDVMMLNIWANVENTTPDTKEQTRFGVPTTNDCPSENEDYACDCNEICEREVANRGNTFEYEETIHDQALAYGSSDSPEYTEAYATIRASNISDCEDNCNDTREAECECEVSNETSSLVLDPGESIEITCSDGSTSVITMPSGSCGTQTFTVGCCSFEIRSSAGAWVETIRATETILDTTSCGWVNKCVTNGGNWQSMPNNAGQRCSANFTCYAKSTEQVCSMPTGVTGGNVSCDACADYTGGADITSNVCSTMNCDEWRCE